MADPLNPTEKEMREHEDLLVETFVARAKAELPYFWDIAYGPEQTVVVCYRGQDVQSIHRLDVAYDVVKALDELKELVRTVLEKQK